MDGPTRRPSRCARPWRTFCATTSTSRAPTSAASTAYAERAPSSLTAPPSARACCSRPRCTATRSRPSRGRPLTAAAAEELTMLATVTRVVNLPMIVGLRLLEKEDGVKVAIKDLRSPESVMLAVIEGQGQVATGFAPFYPAIEKGAPVRGV